MHWSPFQSARSSRLVVLAFALFAILAIVVALAPVSAALPASEHSTSSAVTEFAVPLIALPFTWALLVRN